MSATTPLTLIVGLGNPGSGYAETRHNVGFWFVDRLAEAVGAPFRPESRFHGELAEATLAGERIRLLKPTTFMNLSGQSVAALARFYRPRFWWFTTTSICRLARRGSRSAEVTADTTACATSSPGSARATSCVCASASVIRAIARG